MVRPGTAAQKHSVYSTMKGTNSDALLSLDAFCYSRGNALLLSWPFSVCDPSQKLHENSMLQKRSGSMATENRTDVFSIPAFCVGSNVEVLAAVILVTFLLAFSPWSVHEAFRSPFVRCEMVVFT